MLSPVSCSLAGIMLILTGLLEVGGLLFSISMPPCALLLRRGVHNCCGADECWNLGKIEFKI